MITAKNTHAPLGRYQSEVVSPLQTMITCGTSGQMLIVYHPGLSSFPTTIVSKFAEGATSRNWIVDISTVSHESPRDMAHYDSIMILSPVYGGIPQVAISTYLASVNLLGKPVVAILTSGSGSPKPMQDLITQVKAANGRNLAQASYIAGIRMTEQLTDAYQLGANQSLIDAR